MRSVSTSPLIPLLAMAQLGLAALVLLSGLMAAEVSSALSVVGVAWGLGAAAAAIGLLQRRAVAWSFALVQDGMLLVLLLAFVSVQLLATLGTSGWSSRGAAQGLGWFLWLYAAPTLLIAVGLWRTRPRATPGFPVADQPGPPPT